QVTELLYRVAEQIDGERTLGQIAEGVTNSTEWLVEADDVLHLIRAKFIPLGLIAAADGPPAPGEGATGGSPPRSPLAVQMRMKALSPRLIGPTAGALRMFHAPPVLIPLLIAIVAAHVWLYRVHGVLG